MKRKVVIALVTGMMVISLAGCGTQTKATDDEVEDGETIIVTEEEDTTTMDTEDEITDTEVVEEIQEEATYTEYELFYMRDSLDMTDATAMDMNALSVDGNTYTLNKSINIYAPAVGALMGYTKPNIEVYVNSCNEEWYCLRFDNVDGNTEFVLAKADDFIAATGIEPKEEITITADDVKQAFTELVSKLEIEYELLELPSEDMEYIEFSIPKDCENLEDWIGQMYISNDMSHYATYCIELQDTDYGDGYMNFKFYYKNLKELPQ